VLDFVKFYADQYVRFVRQQPGLFVEMTETVGILLDHIERRTAYTTYVEHTRGYPRRVRVLAMAWVVATPGNDAGVFSIDLTPQFDGRPRIHHQMRWRRPGDGWMNMSMSVPIGSLADIDRNIPETLAGWRHLIHSSPAKVSS
jgi:hypothetical protein